MRPCWALKCFFWPRWYVSGLRECGVRSLLSLKCEAFQGRILQLRCHRSRPSPSTRMFRRLCKLLRNILQVATTLIGHPVSEYLCQTCMQQQNTCHCLSPASDTVCLKLLTLSNEQINMITTGTKVVDCSS